MVSGTRARVASSDRRRLLHLNEMLLSNGQSVAGDVTLVMYGLMCSSDSETCGVEYKYNHAMYYTQ